MVLSLILGLLMETETSSSSNSDETRKEHKQRVCPICIHLQSSSIPSILCTKCITFMEFQWKDHRRDASEAEQREQRRMTTVMIFLSVVFISIFFLADVMSDFWTWTIARFTSGIDARDGK